jgi:hypothetical protein
MTIEKRLERLEAILDARGLDWDHPRVTDEPPKEPPKKWRILDPGEVVCSSDWICARSNPPSDPPNGLGWRPVAASVGTSVFGEVDDYCVFARAVADEPAKEAEPAWEPKVGDWVLVTMPEDWKLLKDPALVASMHKYDGKVMQVVRYEQRYGAWVANFCGIDWFFKRDWLSPAEPPEPLKPPEPEYREPVLPGDLGKWAELSQDGSVWHRWRLCGCYRRAGDKEISWNAVNAGNISFRHARIKKDA